MVTKLTRYLKIYWKLVKFSASLEMEYRLSFLLEVFVEIAFFSVTITGLQVIFYNVTEIAGWDYNELLFLMGIQMVFTELILGFVFIYNLRELPDKIARGNLDLVLTKPINSQFAVSLWRPYFALFPSLLAGVVVALKGFSASGHVFSWVNLLPFSVVFLSGLVMAYSVGMIVTTFSMWMINAGPLPMLGQQLLFLSKNPSSMFTGATKIFFMTILPISFMVSFPSSILLGDIQWWWVPASIVLAFIFLKCSNWFWGLALRTYSSASS